ncbi:hypothetical protein D3C81_1352750 [compost metagenome]
MAEVVDQRQGDAAISFDLGDLQLDFVFARQIRVLIGMPVFVIGGEDFVAGAALVAPTAQVVGVLLPEVLRQLRGAGVEQAEIVQRAVVFVILRINAGDRRLDAQVDVLGDEHHRHVRRLFLQHQDGAEDGVVRDDLAEALARVEVAGLEIQAAGTLRAAQLQALRTRQRHALLHAADACRFDQLIQKATHLARVAACFGGSFLAVVQLLDYLHGQVDIVFLEFEQRGWIVHQHVGIQYVDALASGHRRFLVAGQGHAIAPAGRGDDMGWNGMWVTWFERPSVLQARHRHGRRL